MPSSTSRSRGSSARKPGAHGGDGSRHGGGDGGGGGGDGGDLVKVAYATNDAEAKLIQGLLAENGIPSLIKGTGVDTQFPAIGTRDVYVAAKVAEQARQVLAGFPGVD